MGRKKKAKNEYRCNYCPFVSEYGSGISAHIRIKHPDHGGRGGYTTHEQSTHTDAGRADLEEANRANRFTSLPAPVLDLSGVKSAITDGFRDLMAQHSYQQPQVAQAPEPEPVTEGSPMAERDTKDEKAPAPLSEDTGKKLCEGIECLKDEFKSSFNEMGKMLSDRLGHTTPPAAQPQSEPQTDHTHHHKDPKADAEAIVDEMLKCDEHGPHLKRAILRRFRPLFPNLILRSRESMKAEMQQMKEKIEKEINASTGKSEDQAEEPQEAPVESKESGQAEGAPVSPGQADGARGGEQPTAGPSAEPKLATVEPPADAAPGEVFTAPDGRVCEVGADGKSYCFDKYGV